jgi:hypothetical protein
MKLTVSLLAAAVLAAPAAAAAPKAKHTSAGNAAAAVSLITISDLGKGWTAGKAGTPGLKLVCPGWAPSGKGVVETGVAGSPSFSASPSGPFLSQTTSVYGSAGQASAYWKRAVQPGLVTCVAQTVDALKAQGIKVKILSQGNLPVAKASNLTAGYRAVARLTAAKATPKKLFFDVVLVGKGDALSEITLTSFAAPVPPKVENALATLVAHRIGTPTA